MSSGVIDFVIRSEPAGQMRPRAASLGGRARMYKAPKQAMREQMIAAAWIEAGEPRIEGRVPIRFEVISYLSRPKGHFKKDGSHTIAGQREWRPMKKPDLSNITKMVEDVLNTSKAWHDDALICSGSHDKLWSDDPANPMAPHPCTTVRAYAIAVPAHLEDLLGVAA